jgi:hypothetical protein
MVTTFEPTSRGTDADQFVVPLAAPDCPIFVDQVTEVTPTLSLAVPLKAIVADDVETVVAPGDAMVNVGGVVSVPVPVAGGVVGGAVVAGAVCLVTVTTCDTWLEPAVAVTVIAFAPGARGIFAIVHAVVPVATPEIAIDDDEVDQDTETVPDPPVAVPDRFSVAAVVVAAVAAILSVTGVAGGEAGVGVGAGADAFGCAAYNVCTAAISSAVSLETIL